MKTGFHKVRMKIKFQVWHKSVVCKNKKELLVNTAAVRQFNYFTSGILKRER